jgi:hypothetical protein
MPAYQVNDRVEFIHPENEDHYVGTIVDVFPDPEGFEADDAYVIEYENEDEEEDEVEVYTPDIVMLTAGPTYNARRQQIPLPAQGTTTGSAFTTTITTSSRPWISIDETFFAPEPAPLPTPNLPQVQECRSITGLRRDDYTPTTDSTRLFSFRILRQGDLREVLVAPTFNTRHGGIEFVDEGGNVWLNHFQQEGINRFRRRFDRFDIGWMLKSEYDNEVFRARLLGTPLPTRGKKKLRHKYGEMPVIKEEKYYVSKNFIA